MPWRNGAGTTLEVARFPAEGAEFSWRLSLASIAAGGPFSAYPGYARIVALVDGAGFTLTSPGNSEQTLSKAGAWARFAGAAETQCALLAGPCTDLSLIVREPGAIGAVRCVDVHADTPLVPEPSSLRAVFCLGGAIEFHLPGGDTGTLEPRDTLLYREVTGSVVLRQSGGLPASAFSVSWRPANDGFPD